jgi:hypothetical protein
LVGCCSHVTRRHSRFIDEYEQGVDEIIAACRGDLRGTVKASMLISRAACYTDRLKLAIQSRLRTTLLSLTRPPIRRRIARRNLRPPQRDQMAALVWIPAHLRAILCSACTAPAHRSVSSSAAARCRARRFDGYRSRGNGSASPSVGEGCAGPLKVSMRLFQASQASLSASLRASAARSAAIRTEVP